MEEYINLRIFQPLNIKNWEWTKDPQGISDAASGLTISQFDFTKIGYLFLKNGVWKNKLLVSEQWVETSTKVQSLVNNQFHFGYVWWRFDDQLISNELTTNDVYFFPGALGNHLYIIPHKNLIVSIGAKNSGHPLYNPSLFLFFEILNGIP
jgi:CubicO group peptidase (beta-lactamase class C family)